MGDVVDSCSSAGGHFNPLNKDHGARDADVRHHGDLGNVVADSSGVVDSTFTDSLVTLYDTYSVLGRACMLHSLADDLGLGGDAESKITGNAGSRIACGTFGMANEWISRGALVACGSALFAFVLGTYAFLF